MQDRFHLSKNGLSLNKYLLISVVILLLYFLLHVYRGEDSHVFIHDNLEDNFVKYYILKTNNALFADSNTTIPNYLGGIPKYTFVQLLIALKILFYIFPPFWALYVNKILMHTVAFVGMYLLLKNHIVKKDNELIVWGVSLCFALLPFWPPGGLSHAGYPLVLNSFLNFRNNKIKVQDFIVLLIVPFYSSLTSSYIFFLFCISIYWIYLIIKTKRINWFLFFAIMIFAGVFVFTNWELINLTFFTDYVSLREEMKPNYVPFIRSVLRTGKNFLLGQWHVESLQTVVILPILFFVSLHMLKKKRFVKELILVTIVTICFSLIYGFNKWEAVSIVENVIPFMQKFSWSRFYHLNILTWSLIFALCLKYLSDRVLKKSHIPIVIVLCVQLLYCFINSHEIKGSLSAEPSYSEFFARDLYREIDAYIGRDKTTYRVGSIGLHPAVAIYNGFYTIDGYHAYFTLEYKHKIRKIIEKELEKDEHWRQYFDDWGSRLYLYSSEIDDYSLKKGSGKEIRNLELNMEAFKDLGGEYLFSAVPVLNHKENDLTFLKHFDTGRSYWEVFLYQTNSK